MYVQFLTREKAVLDYMYVNKMTSFSKVGYFKGYPLHK